MKDEKTTQKDENVRHLALYRKYRPQEFKEVFGQDLAIQVLETAIQQDKIYHAYIFSGDRGTGKTTVARIFAKNIGCSQDDIFELDAASNNKVEDIRLIIDATQASTFGSRYNQFDCYKVFQALVNLPEVSALYPLPQNYAALPYFQTCHP